MCITSSGVVIRTSMSEISRIGRATQGVRIMKVKEDEKVAAITKIKSEDDDEKVETPELTMPLPLKVEE